MKSMALVLGALIISVPAALADSREEKVAKYIKDIESGNAKARAEAAKEIGNIAAIRVSYAKPAIEPMLKLLKDKEASVRAAAAEALGKCDEPKKTVKPLIDLLKEDKEQQVKVGAAVGLGLIGEPAKDAVKILRETAQAARQDKNMRLAQACQQAIQNINGARKK
jgi:vesicle coat complex subunit